MLTSKSKKKLKKNPEKSKMSEVIEDLSEEDDESVIRENDDIF